MEQITTHTSYHSIDNKINENTNSTNISKRLTINEGSVEGLNNTNQTKQVKSGSFQKNGNVKKKKRKSIYSQDTEKDKEKWKSSKDKEKDKPSKDKEKWKPSKDKEKDKPSKEKEKWKPSKDKEKDKPSKDKEKWKPSKDKEKEKPSKDKDKKKKKKKRKHQKPQLSDIEVVLGHRTIRVVSIWLPEECEEKMKQKTRSKVSYIFK